MLDTVIGSANKILDSSTIQLSVTHIGTHNKFRYYTYETILVNSNRTGQPLHFLLGRRLRCHVKYRDAYNRLFADIEFE